MAAHLANGRINIGAIRESARKELLQRLDSFSGPKAIVWDDQLIGPFGLIAEYALLKDHDVIKMFTIRKDIPLPTNVQHIIFLTRAHLPIMDIIAENIRRQDTKQQRIEYHIFFVPRKSILCNKRLEALGVYGDFNYTDINVELYPLESDLVTMELPTSFYECHVENDMTSMYHVARALMTIQALYGVIPSIYGKGTCAKHVYELMLRMRRELSGNEPHITSQIDSLLLIDREVDILTPLLTPLTYEGLLDEIYNINSTIVKVPPEKFVKETEGPPEIPTEPKQILLNSAEEMFADLRDRNFSAVGPMLSKRAKSIASQFEERKDAKTVGEIKRFVAKLPQLQAAKQSLATHTSLAELIKDVTDTDEFMESFLVEQDFVNIIDADKPHPYIEECIAKQENIIKVLRLICTQSFCNSGLKQKVLDYYRREIIQTYGYQYILTLQNLEKVGLLKLQDQRPYTVLRKALKLTVDDVNTQNPSDIAYVHNAFAPISIRLAQNLARPGWRAIQDALRLLPGPTIDEVQHIPAGLRKRRGSGSSIQSSTEDQRVTMVFFLGGCTYSEIAALRFLSLLDDYPTEYVIVTTNIINGNTFIKSLTEKADLRPSASAST